MNSRPFYSKMFKDEFFASLTPQEKILFIYFLFNPLVNIIHLYEVTTREVLFDTGVTSEELENAKNKFQAHKKLHFYKNYIYITNAFRYQRYTGPDNEKAKRRLYDLLPKDVLDWYYSISDTPVTPLSHPLSYSYSSSKRDDISKDLHITTREPEIDVDEVAEAIEKLNSGKN